MELYVLIVGNPFDGLRIYGPWTDANLAQEYADQNHDDADWWVMQVVSVEGETEQLVLPDEEG